MGSGSLDHNHGKIIGKRGSVISEFSNRFADGIKYFLR